MDKYIIKFTLVTIATSLGYYYIFQEWPAFFIGSACTSIFWFFTQRKIDKPANDLIEFLIEMLEQKDKQFISLRKMVEENNKDDRDFTNKN